MNEEPVPTQKKRGRKPIGDKAMDASERKLRSRRLQNEQGSVECLIRLSGGTLNFIDQLALANGASRSMVIEGLIDFAVARVALGVADAERVKSQGGSDEAAEAALKNAIEVTLRPGSVAKYKEVLGIK
ncbi:hypothetical protein [Polaromonas sp. AET17H-212]|uniref:hypothetical protein n=1 Tax=Polaromonas sp. AET17H-212 TaxID=1977061 RepID=UPI0011440A32|nr:hypothetical protein [Polaromonas sp. AET17H-212]